MLKFRPNKIDRLMLTTNKPRGLLKDPNNYTQAANLLNQSAERSIQITERRENINSAQDSN